MIRTGRRAECPDVPVPPTPVRVATGNVRHGLDPRTMPRGPGLRDRAAQPASAARSAPWDNEPRVLLRAEVGATGVVVSSTHLSYLPWRGLRQLRVAMGCRGGGGRRRGADGGPEPAAPAAAPGAEPAPWHTVHAGPTFPTWRPGLALDHILTRRCRQRKVRAATGGPSDHLPVVGLLEPG
jgi:endonuclease/exonuclease/phosphatase family metal-dependent hydrolase